VGGWRDQKMTGGSVVKGRRGKERRGGREGEEGDRREDTRNNGFN
jgi:hypothetical protein